MIEVVSATTLREKMVRCSTAREPPAAGPDLIVVKGSSKPPPGAVAVSLPNWRL